MTYRALFIADVHAGNQLPWAVKSPETLVTDRLLDIMDALRQVETYAVQNDIKHIWFLGDLIDRRLVDAVTLKFVTDRLLYMQALGLRVFLVPGNHEAGDAACKHFTVDAFASMGFWVAGVAGSEQLDDPQVSTISPVDGFRMLAMPYLPAPRAIAILGQAADWDVTVSLLHQTIKGGMVGGWTSPEGLDPEMLLSVSPHVLSGHFHSPQTIEAGGVKRVHYLGAPVQHTFADRDEERGFWDIEWVGKFCKRKMVPIEGAPLFHELEWKTGEDPPDVTSICAKAYVNLKLVGLSTEVKKQWKTAQAWADQLRAERELRMVKLVSGEVQTEHKQRITFADNGERPTWDTVLSRYLDQADCTGLDRNRLEQLGKELMADADK